MASRAQGIGLMAAFILSTTSNRAAGISRGAPVSHSDKQTVETTNEYHTGLQLSLTTPTQTQTTASAQCAEPKTKRNYDENFSSLS